MRVKRERNNPAIIVISTVAIRTKRIINWYLAASPGGCPPRISANRTSRWSEID